MFKADKHKCNHGELWEPIPPPVPAITRFKRWLVG